MVAKFVCALALFAVLSVVFAADPTTPAPPTDTGPAGPPQGDTAKWAPDVGGSNWDGGSDVGGEDYAKKHPKPYKPCFIRYKKCCYKYYPKWCYGKNGKKHQCGWKEEKYCGDFHKTDCVKPWCQYFHD
jgi:hypothetical protein